MVQIDLGERLIRLADKVLSKNSNETIGHTGGITNATANDTYIPTTKAVKEYVDDKFNIIELQVGEDYGTFAELQTIINNAQAGDTIILDKDYKNDGSSIVDGIGIEIHKDLTIIGNGHIIDGNHLSSIFSTDYTTLTFENITLMNGNGLIDDANGGALYGDGGALYGDNLNLINCNFINNVSAHVGGAINGNGEMHIIECNFINNKVDDGDGGAIFCFSNNMTVTNSTFINNNANGNGGAISLGVDNNSLFNISNCVFIDNAATNNGGGIFAGTRSTSGENLKIYNCTFENSTLYNTTNVDYLTGSEVVSSWEQTLSDEKVPSEKLVKEYIDNLPGKEDKSNKVTSISSSSTDTQYPSAKAVYDVINTGTITPTNKNFITTSFTPSKLITDSYRERVNNHNSFTLVSDNKIPEEIIGAYCKFDFGCQNNEYYEFDITISKGSADIYDSESEMSYYHLYRDAICTIKITHDELIVHEIDIDETTVIDLSNSDGILTFSAKPSTICQLDFSNKKWYHEATFFDKIYPIGCVHITTNSVNPSNYFDGEWERIEDTFLLASGTTYENGSTGGSATVTLTSAQSGVPQHTHTYAHTDTTYKANTTSRKPGTATAANYVTSITGTANNTTKTSSNNTAANASQAHENMPPYLSVYMWKRTA